MGMVYLTGDWRPRRSVLFVPASNARAMEKSRSLTCDAIIFDLEDSMLPGGEAEARDRLARSAGIEACGGRERIVRINTPDSAEFPAGLDAAIETAPDAILLPKLETAAALHAMRKRIGPDGPALWAMIETPRAILDLSEIVRAAPDTGLAALVIGPNDLAKSTGVKLSANRAPMIPWFMSVIAAARACNLAVLDGVCNNFRDIAAFEAECRQGAELGFDGKTLIHPAQIAPANAIFGPQPEDVANARRIVEAFDLPANRGAGVIQIDGEMVERLHLDAAQRLLHLAGTIGQIDGG
jgi:citrate lyase subunit beta / citryl-CoA lyase